MTRKVLNTLAAVGTVVVCGCALDQAPLVYSSRMSAGVDISTNASESPGVSINIGVKTVDAAYVPVAVARRPGDGASAPAEVIKILAQYGQGRSGRDGAALGAEDRARLDAYVRARQDEDDAAEGLRKAVERIKTSEGKENRIQRALAALEQASVAPAPGASAGSGGSGAEGAAWPDGVARALRSVGDGVADQLLTEGAEPAAAQTALKSLLGRQRLESQRLEVARQSAEVLLKRRQEVSGQRLSEAAAAAELLQTSKSDAMSVFGSFGNNAGANGVNEAASGPSARAHLNTQKVFSTGLASQNLTEAVKLSTVADCMAQAAKVMATVAAASSASGVSGEQLQAIAVASATTCGAVASAR